MLINLFGITAMHPKKLTVLMLSLALTGCSGGKVIFNKEDPNSGYVKSAKVEVVNATDPECTYVISPTSGTAATEAALAVGAIGYNLINREVNSWIKDEISKYNFNYTALTNYLPQNENVADYQEMCFSFSRKVYTDAKNEKQDEGLSFDFDFVRLGDSKAFMTVLKNIRLEKSGALTTNREGIELVISITISTPKPESSEPKLITVANFNISNVNFKKGDNAYNYDEVFYGPVFNAIPYKTPVTIAVAVQEKGVGVKNLTNLQEDIANNGDSLKSLLNMAIKKRFE